MCGRLCPSILTIPISAGAMVGDMVGDDLDQITCGGKEKCSNDAAFTTVVSSADVSDTVVNYFGDVDTWEVHGLLVCGKKGACYCSKVYFSSFYVLCPKLAWHSALYWLCLIFNIVLDHSKEKEVFC